MAKLVAKRPGSSAIRLRTRRLLRTIRDCLRLVVTASEGSIPLCFPEKWTPSDAQRTVFHGILWGTGRPFGVTLCRRVQDLRNSDEVSYHPTGFLNRCAKLIHSTPPGIMLASLSSMLTMVHRRLWLIPGPRVIACPRTASSRSDLTNVPVRPFRG